MALSLPVVLVIWQMPKERPSVGNRYSPTATHARRPGQMGWTGDRRQRRNKSGCPTGRLGLARTAKYMVTAFCVDGQTGAN